MAEHEDTLVRVIESLREPVHIDSSLNVRVMRTIEQLPRPVVTQSRSPSLIAWLRNGRTVRITPLTGLAAAAALAAVVFVSSRLGRETIVVPVPSATASNGVVAQFVLVAPQAGSVALVGDFNDWNLSATPLARQEGDGVWWVTVPLSPGRYRYAFVVDGTSWRSDPNAPTAEDEFGRKNSVVTIGG